MLGNTFGRIFQVTTCGESYGWHATAKESGYGGAAQPPLPKSYVYVPAGAGELPGGILPTGLYSTKAGKVQVMLVLSRDGNVLKRLNISGTRSTLASLATRIAEAIGSAASVAPH